MDIRDPDCFSLSASSFSTGGFHPQGNLMITYSCRNSSYHNLALGKRREKKEKSIISQVSYVHLEISHWPHARKTGKRTLNFLKIWTKI